MTRIDVFLCRLLLCIGIIIFVIPYLLSSAVLGEFDKGKF